MRTFMDGACLKVVEKGHQGSVKDLAVDFGMTATTQEGVFKKMEGTLIKKMKEK